jgi:hypothetical protein
VCGAAALIDSAATQIFLPMRLLQLRGAFLSCFMPLLTLCRPRQSRAGWH